jgi:hypothetical protein
MIGNYHKGLCKFKYKILTTKDLDWWTIDSGPEGSGKSTFGIQDAMFCSHDDFVKNWRERITYDPEEFLGQFEIAPMGGTVILDEGGEAWFNRDFASQINKALAKAAMQVRDRNLNVVLCVPNIWYLDTIAIMRHRTWTTVSMPAFQRGHSEFYKPSWRKFGRKVEPYWDLKTEHEFPMLPPRVYLEYKAYKRKRSSERLAKYIDQIDHERAKSEIAPEKVLKKVRASREPLKFKTSRGTWDWKLVMYHCRCGEIPAKTAAAVLNSELRRAAPAPP